MSEKWAWNDQSGKKRVKGAALFKGQTEFAP